MLTKYSELEETQENVSDYYGDYLSRVEDPRTKQKFYMSDVLTKETIWYDEE